MKKLLLLLVLGLALLTLAAKTTVTQVSPGNYKVSWDLPDWKVTADKDFSTISVPELGWPERAGEPSLPFDECKIAVPANGTASVTVSSSKQTTLTLQKRIQPVAAIIPAKQTDAYQYNINETFYAAPVRNIINVMPRQRFRSLSFVPVRINPFTYDGQNSLNVVTHLELSVSISGDTQSKSTLPADDLTSLIAKQTINPFEAGKWLSVEPTRVNYVDFNSSDVWVKIETDKDGMFKITPAQLGSQVNLADIDPRTLRLYTTGGEVQSNSISSNGPALREVPIYVAGESDGSFDANDYILFYGRDRDGLEMNQSIIGNLYVNPYSKNVCYWLTFGVSQSGTYARIPLTESATVATVEATTSPATVRIENEVYQRNTIGFSWFMDKFFGSNNAEYAFPIDLEDLDPNQDQTLSLLLQQEYLGNGSNAYHRAHLDVNGNHLLDLEGGVEEWNWYSLNTNTLSHTGRDFINGSNTISINVLRTSTDNLLLDYYQVAYQKRLIKRAKQFTVQIPGTLAGQAVRYNFTGANTNLRLFVTNVNATNYEVTELPANLVTGGFNFIFTGNAANQVLAVQDADYYAPFSVAKVTPVDLSASATSYDNIIITPQEYHASALGLAAFYHQHFAKDSKVVLLQDIFNQFGGGMPDPNAIRLFLKQAVQNYPAPAITSLTLLGSGTLDWRNFSGNSSGKNKLPVFQKIPNEYATATTSDDYFGMINTDDYPELAIGRYPAKNQAELDIMLGNLERYVTEPASGIWHNSLLLIADDQFNGPTVGEFSHSQQLQETSELINPSVLIDKIFAIDYDYDEFQNKPKARDDMMAGLNAGKLVWYYVGHGSFDVLGAEDYFNGALDLGRFNNPDHLPLFVAASCDVAQYDSYAFDCLAEKVLMKDNAGCIASIAATRECNGPSNVAMLEQYYKYSLNFRNPVGYSLLNAKISYLEVSNDEKYNLLGDPLLLVTTPERDSTLIVSSDSLGNILNSRETIGLAGQFNAPGLNADASLYVFDTAVTRHMPITQNNEYTFRGKTLYQGKATVTASQYNASFVVPDDVTTGTSGLILAYAWDPVLKKDYVNYKSPLPLSDAAYNVENTDAPQILLYLDSTDFADGDIVSASPQLIARISDSNGINLTDSPGHSILLILDQTVSNTNVTKYFAYDTDSHTAGTLNYQLTGLSKGPHMLQLIAFDNFNRPSVQTVNFLVESSGTFAIDNFLPYPNPMPKAGWFTFTASEAADVSIGIYTIRGRKIQTIKASATRGFNKIAWDGRDADGDFLANNTYFIKLTARALSNNKKVEKTEKLVVYH